MSIEASCHCGAVRLEIMTPPQSVTDCNCSICRRYGALWAYYSPQDVKILTAAGATEFYRWGEGSIEFHRCKSCGCASHWSAVDRGANRMGVNARLMDPALLRTVPVRKVDGAARD